jgi:hypothetical protein
LPITAPEDGYALPLVLVGIAVLLVLAGTAASRISREARVTKLEEHAEAAYHAAEAGFNRVRSLAVRCDGSPASLDGHSETLTFLDETGAAQTGGRYQITVIGTGPWDVTAIGFYGSGAFTATRVVKGTVSITPPVPPKPPKSPPPCTYNKVVTTYTP